MILEAISQNFLCCMMAEYSTYKLKIILKNNYYLELWMQTLPFWFIYTYLSH